MIIFCRLFKEALQLVFWLPLVIDEVKHGDGLRGMFKEVSSPRFRQVSAVIYLWGRSKLLAFCRPPFFELPKQF